MEQPNCYELHEDETIVVGDGIEITLTEIVSHMAIFEVDRNSYTLVYGNDQEVKKGEQIGYTKTGCKNIGVTIQNVTPDYVQVCTCSTIKVLAAMK